jgi:hypothetical protein
MSGQEAKAYVQDTCAGLREVKENLKGAADNVEKHTVRERIESQMANVERCLAECESIVNSLK